MRKVCNSLFTESENQTFIGETILKTAAREKNQEKKEQMMKEAIDQIQRNPLAIDLRQTLPVLIENGHYLSIVDLCLKKACLLARAGEKESETQARLDECYAVILHLISALEFSITNEPSSNIIDFLRPKSKKKEDLDADPYFNVFLRKLKEFPKNEMKVMLRNKIVRKIEESRDSVLVWTVYTFMLSKPSLNLENLPQVSDQDFIEIRSQIFSHGEISKEVLENLLKVMQKKQMVEELGRLILQVASDSLDMVKVPLEDKFKYVCNALLICERKQMERRTQEVDKIVEELSFLAAVLKRKCLIQDCLRAKEAQIFKNIQRIQDLNDDALLPKEEELMKEQGVLGELQRLLDTEIHDVKDYDADYTNEFRLHQASYLILLEEIKVPSHPDALGVLEKKLREVARLYLEELARLFEKEWEAKVEELLWELIVKAERWLLQLVLKEFNRQVEKLYEEDTLLKQVQQIRKGGSLKGTRFWLVQFAFESCPLFLPSELFNLFAYRSLHYIDMLLAEQPTINN